MQATSTDLRITARFLSALTEREWGYSGNTHLVCGELLFTITGIDKAWEIRGLYSTPDLRLTGGYLSTTVPREATARTVAEAIAQMLPEYERQQKEIHANWHNTVAGQRRRLTLAAKLARQAGLTGMVDETGFRFRKGTVEVTEPNAVKMSLEVTPAQAKAILDLLD